MNIETLKNIGLSEKSAKIYLSMLSLGTTTAKKISENTEIKRPTVYLHLTELIKEGLVAKTLFGKKEYYLATNPEILEKRAQKSLNDITTALPSLLKLATSHSFASKIKVLYGKKSVAEVYREIAEAHSIRFWTDLSVFESHFAEAFKELSLAISEKQIRTKEIITDSLLSRRASKRYSIVAGKTYSSRISTIEGIHNDSAVYGDVVVLFKIQEAEVYVIRIEDKSIAETMKALFDLAWRSAKQFIN